MEVNKFADLTPVEFKARFASSYRPASSVRGTGQQAPNVSAPASVDWSAKGAVCPLYTSPSPRD